MKRPILTKTLQVNETSYYISLTQSCKLSSCHKMLSKHAHTPKHTQIYSHWHIHVRTLSLFRSLSLLHRHSLTHTHKHKPRLTLTQTHKQMYTHTPMQARTHTAAAAATKFLERNARKKDPTETFRRRKKSETETFRVSVGIRHRENFGSEKSSLETKQNKSFFCLIEKRIKRKKTVVTLILSKCHLRQKVDIKRIMNRF